MNYLLLVAGSFSTLLGQLLLKKGASKSLSLTSLFLNKYSLSGFVFFVAAIFFNVIALRVLPLIMLIVFQALTSLLTVVLSNRIYSEDFNQKQSFGLILVIIGIIIFYI